MFDGLGVLSFCCLVRGHWMFAVGAPGLDNWKTSLQLVIVVLKSVRRHPAAQTLPLYLTSGGERVRKREMKAPLCDDPLEKWARKVEAKTRFCAIVFVMIEKGYLLSLHNEYDCGSESKASSSFTEVWFSPLYVAHACLVWVGARLGTQQCLWPSANQQQCRLVFPVVCPSAPYTTHSLIQSRCVHCNRLAGPGIWNVQIEF